MTSIESQHENLNTSLPNCCFEV